ncbi:DNA-3-methyladenine glycosylase I [Halothiobacillus sp.]|uniref:DNA-3-methyladenine glycosylase I n=1 Tax=Halothiobacillus sp. TaxID=1891311 RepID=UPI003D0BF62C
MDLPPTLTTDHDGRPRCAWCAAAPEFPEYHDNEWGFPVDDDVRLFEKVCLEGFQAGLSWRTILVKRPAFRDAFLDFDFHRIAQFTEQDVAKLMCNRGIVRHRGKIEAVINNARRAIEMVQNHGSLSAFFWRYEPDPRQLPEPQTATTCPEAIALSKELKKLGWKFVGPTTLFAFMQAMGMVNDHVHGCITRNAVEKARSEFKRPG